MVIQRRPPLLGDEGGRARATGRVEYEIPGIGAHKKTALRDRGCSLYNVVLVSRAAHVAPYF